ncbi:MAG: type IX secretion system outer membrane channel protein PorV [Bacteroidetes bacterium]|nr:type IX secretion system outer membrane channel protein PorV [Bacteroidota bacterium]MBL0096579.1 type IX secretion system outer membrane channel protein PorV [Bacteroidota bacterium]
MMNKQLTKFFFVPALLALLTVNSSAQNTNLLGQLNTITTAVPFVMISPDARAGGMGDQGVASAPDVNSIHWNPAKLAFAEKKMGFGVSYTPWLRALVNDMFIAYLSGYSKMKGDQAIGASLRYFSLGNITFTDVNGNTIRDFKPNEFALDVAYSRKLSEYFSGGIALRFIHSNLTGGTQVEGQDSKAGNTVAADVSVYFQKEIELGNKEAIFTSGVNISNIGAKISYTESGVKNFIPTNLRLGPGLKLKLNEYNELGFMLDINKLLVPTPPIYTQDTANSADNIILYGEDPDVSVAQGIFQSFSDAPNGFKEELQEINIGFGMEYWYDKQFAFRAGYFHENQRKGNRKYFTLGAGLRYNVFGIDLAYLIPTDQRNPLENTLHFTLTFDFDAMSGDKDKDAEE